MQAVKANLTKGLNFGAWIPTCDNSGAKVVKLFGAKGNKPVKGRMGCAGIGDLVMVSIVKGKPEMRKQTALGVIVRQRRAFRRPDGMRVKFEDNAVVIVKDDKANPKGTLIKGPVAKEAVERWGNLAKIAKIVV